MTPVRLIQHHWTLLVLTVCATVTFLAVGRCRTVEADSKLLGWKLDQQVQLSDSTAAELADTRLDRDRYAGLLRDVEDSIHGKLIAAVLIRVPKRDTVIVYDTLETERRPDSTRTATFRDSTFAGVISGQVVAPPFPAALSLQYQVSRPAFAPTVGFFQVGKRHIAVVTWQGERFELDAPYVDPKAVVPPRVSGFGEVEVDPFGIPTVGAGADLRAVWGLEAFVRLQQRLTYGEDPRVGVGVRKRF